MKKAYGLRLWSCSFVLSHLLFAQSVLALPSNGQILCGNATFQNTEKTLTITADKNTVIQWDSFDIQVDETVEILLTDPSDQVQLLIRNEKATEISGHLLANGHVSLINPKGIAIGSVGDVECVALTAIALDAKFTDSANGIELSYENRGVGLLANCGSIKTQEQLMLIGQKIENQGKLFSSNSKVSLLSASSVSLFAATTPGFVLDGVGTIVNKGVIQGRQICLASHSNSLLDLTIVNEGELISAKGDQNIPSILVHAQDSTFFNKSQIHSKGGNIVLLGGKIILDDEAIVDASGELNGGNIFVGGGRQGSDPSIPNAEIVAVHRRAQIIADAKLSGKGGDIVVWADKANTFLGSISSTGSMGGNAEVSCNESLYFDGKCCLHSCDGAQGTLLIDPATITIQASGPNIDGLGLGHDITTANELALATTFPGVNSIITSGAVDALLTGGVTMTLSAVNSITVNSPVSASGVVTGFVLNAPIVNLNQPITLSFGGTLSGTAPVVNVGPSGSIQNGIDAVAVGGTVNVATATYIEEILITKNLTLNGSGIGNTVIVCPTTPTPLANSFVYLINGATYHPFVMAQGPTNVIIQNLTVDGNSQASNFLSFRFLGIGFHNAGGTIQNVHVTNVEDSFPGGPTQHGEAIFVAVDNGMPFTITVQNNTVDRFQKSGINIRGAPLTANILNNIVTGETPPSNATASGILSRDGAQSLIQGNTVTNILSATPGVDSVAIFLLGTGDPTTVTQNTVNNNNVGIFSQNSLGNLTISSNIVNNNTNTGIVVIDTAGTTTLTANTMTDNVSTNMFLQSTANQPFNLANNQFIGSSIGLLIQGNIATGPVVTMNHDAFIGTIDFYIEEIDAPNDIWPSTQTVSFDGLISGFNMTFAQFQVIQTKIIGSNASPTLGLILQFLPPTFVNPPASFSGRVKKNEFLNKDEYLLTSSWLPSTSSGIIFYRIFNHGKLIAQISATSPLEFNHCFHHKPFITITAVNSNNMESPPLPLNQSFDGPSVFGGVPFFLPIFSLNPSPD